MIDVAIVGGGPAGLATAIAARARGLGALVLEAKRPPIDKACGEGLMPSGVAALRALGVELAPGDARPFAGIRFVDASEHDAPFARGFGVGVRRTRLHAAMARRAEEAGAELRWGTAATALARDGLETDAGPVRARCVVGADGLHSRVRRWAGLDAGAGPRRRFGVRRHVAIAPWSDRVEVHFGARAEAYVTPIGAREVGVAILTGDDPPRFDALLLEFPRLGERLRGAPAISEDRGAGPFDQRARAVANGGRDGAASVALVGDAAGYLDPITGEGLGLAFHQAIALARALAAGDLDAYARDHARLVAAPSRRTRFVLALRPRPWLRRPVMRALAISSAARRLAGLAAP